MGRLLRIPVSFKKVRTYEEYQLEKSVSKAAKAKKYKPYEDKFYDPKTGVIYIAVEGVKGVEFVITKDTIDLATLVGGIDTQEKLNEIQEKIGTGYTVVIEGNLYMARDSNGFLYPISVDGTVIDSVQPEYPESIKINNKNIE